MCGLYVLVSEECDKYYVGSSQDIDKRVARHFNELELGKHHNENLQKLWNDGVVFTVKKYLFETREDAYEAEQDFINRHANNGELLNIGRHVKGGDNLSRHPRRQELIDAMRLSIINRYSEMSPEERKVVYGKPGKQNGMYGRSQSAAARFKMSNSHKGRTYRKGFSVSEETKALLSEKAKLRVGEKNPFFGKSHTEETKSKLREKMRGKLPPNTLKVSIDGVVYKSLTDASRLLDIPVPTISWRIKSQNSKYSQYRLVS